MSQEVQQSMQNIGVYPFPIATWPLADSEDGPKDIDIMDIRGTDTDDPDLAIEIKTSLQAQHHNGSRSFPSSLLSSEQGLKILDDMSTVETELLARHAHEIVLRLLAGTILLEIGPGSLQRIKVLLEAVESHHKIMDYYTLDPDKEKLARTLNALSLKRFNYVRCHGLLGSYEDGRKWIAKYENKQRPVCVLSLDATFSTICPDEASQFWRLWSDLLTINNKFNSNNARIILGIDHRTDGDNVSSSSRNSSDFDQRLIESVVGHANSRLGYPAFEASAWSSYCEWDATSKTCTQFLVTNKDATLQVEHVKAGEKLCLARSCRYDGAAMEELLENSNLKELRRYMNRSKDYGRSHWLYYRVQLRSTTD